jgi:PST family polysaccharide transporter
VTLDSSQPSTSRPSSYGQILRSSAIIGGSSALNLAVSILRTKVLAVMLAPAGFGLMGAFNTATDLARSFAQMGVNSSGVRQIAESAATDDSRRIALTVLVLRRMAIVLGVLGTLLFALFARDISQLTFGNEEYAAPLALLSLVILFRVVADGQAALLQGLRRIGDMAAIGVIGAVLGAVASIVLVALLGEQGIAPALVAVAAASLLVSWWYARKVRVDRPEITPTTAWKEANAMLQMGLAFMASALLTMGAAYVVRLLLIRTEGLEAAGLYQAAWTVAGIYVNFVLQAMGADFYPRLVAVANDDATCNRLVNEQTQVSMLLANTGIIATLCFAPLVVTLLYSAEFSDAAQVLRWVCLGMALRVITWPLGYIMIAKGKRAYFIGTDLAWTVANIGLTWVCVRAFGLVGAGIAFFGSYVFHMLLVWVISRRLCDFRWSASNYSIGLVFLCSISIVQAAFVGLDTVSATLIGGVATIASALYSFNMLRGLVGEIVLPGKLLGIMQKLRRAP